MSDAVNPRRPYDSSRRREQARTTRLLIVNAAQGLFIERGYVATTIEAIAVVAGVSPETIYATFRTKRAVLSAIVAITIAGGDAAPAVIEQDWVDQIRREPDLARRVEMLAANGRAILERRAAIDEVVRSAAAGDREIADLWASGNAERLAGQRNLLRLVIGDGGLAAGVDFQTAVDILYAIGSSETYRLLVIDRRWSASQFERWYASTLTRLLFGP